MTLQSLPSSLSKQTRLEDVSSTEIPKKKKNAPPGRILAMGEAYWDVVPELEGTPAQEMALRTHYGVGGNEEAPWDARMLVG